MFVKDVERGRRLAHGDELLRSLRRHKSVHGKLQLIDRLSGFAAIDQIISLVARTLRTFSGFVCGGGGMLGKLLR